MTPTTQALGHVLIGMLAGAQVAALGVDASVITAAFWGGMGGAARWLALGINWREGTRYTALGVITAAIGAPLWPAAVLWYGAEPDAGVASSPLALNLAAGVIGLASAEIVAVLLRVIKRGPVK